MQKVRPANNSNVLLGNPSHGGGIGPHTVQSFWMQLEETPMLFLLKSKLVFTHPSVCELLSSCWCIAPRQNPNKNIANILFSLCPCRGYSHGINISHELSLSFSLTCSLTSSIGWFLASFLVVSVKSKACSPALTRASFPTLLNSIKTSCR